MMRFAEQLGDGSFLDFSAGIHNHDAVGHFRDRCPEAISRCAEEDPRLEEKAARHTAACIRV